MPRRDMLLAFLVLLYNCGKLSSDGSMKYIHQLKDLTETKSEICCPCSAVFWGKNLPRHAPHCSCQGVCRTQHKMRSKYIRPARLHNQHVFLKRYLRIQHVPILSHSCGVQVSRPRLERLCDGNSTVTSKSCLPLALSAKGRQVLKEILDKGRAEKRIPTEMGMCVEACGDARMLEVYWELSSASHNLSDLYIDEETLAWFCKQTEAYLNEEVSLNLQKCVLIAFVLVLLIMEEKYCSRTGSFIDSNLAHENINDTKAAEKPFTKGKPDDERRLSWRFIFEFRRSQNITLTVCPFTLNQYVNEVVNDHREPNELMKYEWSRYMSFQNFPKDSRVTPMRLAQAGFFWTGQGEEVKCFCCGVKNHVWSDEESVWHAHQRLSPSCRFICGESNDNVPIHGPDYYASMGQN